MKAFLLCLYVALIFLANAAILAGAIWVIVTVLRWMGVIQ